MNPDPSEQLEKLDLIDRVLDRVIYLLDSSNKYEMPFDAHNKLEKAMIDVQWVRNSLKPSKKPHAKKD